MKLIFSILFIFTVIYIGYNFYWYQVPQSPSEEAERYKRKVWIGGILLWLEGIVFTILFLSTK